MESQKDYLTQKKQKKKTAVKAVWFIIVLAIVFIIVIIKFALSGDMDVTTLFSGMPSSDDVYSVSKQFVLPTLKGTDASFSEDGYQFGKKEDSVFVVKSAVETKTNSGDIQKTNFEITLKFKGGPVSNQNSWQLLNLNED